MKSFRILAINPGSTSTKIAIYDGSKCILESNIYHNFEEIDKFKNIIDQYEFRKDKILNTLNEQEINMTKLSAVVGRGGLLKAITGGTYAVNEKMIEDLRLGYQGEHASNLGGLLAYEIASKLNIPAYIVDPVVVDEMNPIARFSGIPEIERKSIFHALNQKAVGRKFAKSIQTDYESLNLIVAHLGGGISVGAHSMGKVIDVNNALDGEGPFSPERSGGLPAYDLVKLCFSGEVTKDQMKKKITGKGGLIAYLGTNSGIEIQNRIKDNDTYAESIYKAMAYQVSKEIGSCAAVLSGKVDGIILTGGLSYDENLVQWITESVKFISNVTVYPGEGEMEALAFGALRVLLGEETSKIYQ